MERRYEQELSVATRLAVEAGARIREEFHREGGPRSSGPSHAEVDAEVEVSIREGLLAAFAADAFVGEETGTHGARDAVRTWYVDPHDGTSSFLQAHRGSAVSIGLVVDGVPVLGVVFAPMAPDDAGDLITWAEGEPLRRNGVPVERAGLPKVLDDDTVLAFSARADAGEAMLEALRIAAPGRVIARPSIAWRLALVAVGEADAALSSSAPAAYDVAAGHALLRAVRGELVDSSGRAIRYGASFGGGDVVGGHKVLAASLAARVARLKQMDPASRRRSCCSIFDLEAHLERVELAVAPISERYPHAKPRWDRRVRDAGLLARAQGALLGQVAGDALGAQVEFAPRAQVLRQFAGEVRDMGEGGPFGLLAGQPTDDSELALLLARSIVTNGGFDAEKVREAYLAWLASTPFDVGTTTRLGLAGGDTTASEANGSAMRISPLAVHLWRNRPEAVCSVAVDDVVLTHESPVCAEATLVLASAIAMAVREGLPPRALYDRIAAWVRSDPVFETPVKQLFAADDVPAVQDFHTHAGWVMVALQNAFHQLLHAPSFEEGVVRTVSQGADADTNGAIAGALLGAVYGRDAVPLRWRRAVLSCRAVRGSEVRPPPFWADDLYELAEQLVATGPEHEVVLDEPASEPAAKVPSIAQARARREREAAARAHLQEVARELLPALEPLRAAAAELALFAGVSFPADLRPDARGVGPAIRALESSKDPAVASVGQALARLVQIAGQREIGD